MTAPTSLFADDLDLILSRLRSVETSTSRNEGGNICSHAYHHSDQEQRANMGLKPHSQSRLFFVKNLDEATQEEKGQAADNIPQGYRAKSYTLALIRISEYILPIL